MATLIAVAYHKRHYPPGIRPAIQEIAGHFDVGAISPVMEYSLHTEYSYGPRDFARPPASGFPAITNAHRNGVPQLWYSDLWAEAFCDFIVQLVGGHRPPAVVEIHPPFDDYCPSMGEFLDRYAVFEERFGGRFPETEILIENRSGTVYKGGSFIVSTAQDVVALTERIAERGHRLRVALDVPQLLSAAGGPQNLSEEKVAGIIRCLQVCRNHIRGLHLWGKKKSPKGPTVSHTGTFDTYFDGDRNKKATFLRALHSLLDDGTPRLFVPEVNSSDEDLSAIVVDLLGAGFRFA